MILSFSLMLTHTPASPVDIFFRIAGDPGARMMRRQEEGEAEGAAEGEKKEAGGTVSRLWLCFSWSATDSLSVGRPPPAPSATAQWVSKVRLVA